MKILDDKSFWRLMSIASNHLVDSNVFIRSLVFCVERYKESIVLENLLSSQACILNDCSYLSHTWHETQSQTFEKASIADNVNSKDTVFVEKRISTEWFLPMSMLARKKTSSSAPQDQVQRDRRLSSFTNMPCIRESGWYFPQDGNDQASIRKIASFLSLNRARLVRNLLAVVELKNVNHENICCLNTAIVIAIFSNRHGQLGDFIEELKHLDENEYYSYRKSNEKKIDDSEILDGMKSLRFEYDIDGEIIAKDHEPDASSKDGNILRNFRELLWFWKTYYINRGRDRLSLEFSSRLRFSEWKQTVSLLCSDDDSKSALSPKPVCLPRSPYKQPPRSRFHGNSY